jgi:serine/threonine protein kinase
MTIIALKCVDIGDKSKRDQLMRELLHLDNTKHAYIVAFYGAFFDNGSTKLALEYMNRGSLQAVINKHGALNERVLSNIIKQMIMGLAYLHSRNQVHRDIKPGNMSF